MTQATIDAYQRGVRDAKWGYSENANPYGTDRKAERAAWKKGYKYGKAKAKSPWA